MSAPPIADAATICLLDAAGLRPGMRVLDFGCGTGAVSRMAADRVGRDGQVVGMDVSETALAAAREQTPTDLHPQVRFAHADDGEEQGGGFNAIIGRRVLMYVPDPVGTVRGLAARLRPDGLIAFQEHDPAGTPLAAGEAPQHARVHAMIWDTVRAESPDCATGMQIPRVFSEAGLAVESVICEANIIVPGQSPDLPFLLSAMADRMRREGVADPATLDMTALTADLARERQQAGPIIWEHIFIVTGRKSDA